MRPVRDLRLSFDSLALGLLVIVIVAVACLAEASPDTYWHLRAGQDIHRTGHVPLTDTYSHTIAGQPWPNHSWLWQAGAFALFDLGAFPLLVLVNAAMAAGALLLSFSLAKGDATRSALLLLLSLPLAGSTWAVRPQVASELLFVALLWMLTRQRFAFIPPLFLLWANAHAAVAIGGLALVTSLGFATFLWWRSPDPARAKRVRVLLVVTGLSGAATVLTPMGTWLWTYIPASITRSRNNGIAEWSSAFHWGAEEAFLWLWAIMFVGAAAARWRRLTQWNDQLLVVLGVATMPLAFSAVRNIAWFVLATLPALRALTRRSSLSAPPDRHDHRAAHTIALVVAGMAAIGAISAVWAVPWRGLGWSPISPEIVSVVEGCPGPLYNHYDNGGYLIWHLPEVPVFIDSRQDPYPAELLERHLAAESTGDYQDLFADYGIACAALPPDSATAQALIADGWTVAAEDQSWTVVYPSAPSR